jgi:hypothetical protein
MNTDIQQLFEALKKFIEYLVSEPAVAFGLAFILMVAVCTEILSRGYNAPFSSRVAFVIATCLAVYGAASLAKQLPTLGQIVAVIVLVGIPLALLMGFAKRRD